ncbi:MAG: radical SAM protein, partial [Candidatus Woesearchaeota archaeon]|nr:radical SAM protein [Candidatus Woesearchaeota archaeon]
MNIDEKRVKEVLEESKSPSKERIKEILSKALELKGLSLEEAACLLNISSDAQELYDTAFKIKNEIYGNRLVIFAPVYVSNHCSNDCLYCGFRKSNSEMKRRILSSDEIRKEVEILEKQGHKRLLMLMGEDFDKYSFDDFLEAINVAYSVKSGGDIRRINVEIPPLS